MHSSTFSFEPALVRAATSRGRGIAIPLAIIASILILLEALTWSVVEKRSKLQQTINQEYREAVGIRRGSEGGRKQLLILGNSLVGYDIDFGMLTRELGPNWRARQFWIHNTAYEDWRFGMRRLFAEGSRPDVVCLVLAGGNWRAAGIRGDYSSPYMFQAADIPAIGSELNYNRTQTSSLLFARFSRFYAVRSEIRKAVLQFLLPDLPQMYELFQPRASKPLSATEVLATIKPRIEKVHRTAQLNGTKLILIVPPVPRPGQEYLQELSSAAREVGIDALTPVSYADMTAADFMDDTHLTPAGAAIFTSKLMPSLRSALNAQDSPANQASGKQDTDSYARASLAPAKRP
ncbi:MAG: hypothetical protein M3Y72_03705 [Acidobacteriota bacterium]|nr:hypothetical protein [Acidobacteriota bacterium]